MTCTQDIFELKCILKNITIKLYSRIESGVKQLLALITDDGDIVLHYTYGELPPIIKRIPWLNELNKTIEAICFDPTATWLLAVSNDSYLYIIPALSLVDKKQKIDCKWALNDLTQFPKHAQTPDSKPTSLVWWQTLDSNQNALVGYENGAIALISLTDGRCLGCCGITEPVNNLYLCQDNSLESVSLMINGERGQQWRLILEQHSMGCLWPPESNNQSDDSTRSRLYNLKQMGVDKLASLKQKLSEARGGNRRDSQNSDTTSDNSSSHSEPITTTITNQYGPELIPCLCDTFFLPQSARKRYLFTALYKQTSLLTVHTFDLESAPLYVHKLIPNTNYTLLTDKLIYTINDEFNLISVISSYMSECRIDGNSDFNSDSLVAQFSIKDERILQIYKLTDLSSVRSRKCRDENNKKDKLFELPKSINDLNISKSRTDTIVVITNNSVYKLIVKCPPVNKCINYITEENDLKKAERISTIFSLNLQQILESSGDLLISRGQFHSGIILYKQAKVHLLKRVLKLAISADCRTLLKFVHLCLSSSKIDMSMATKIHIGNLAVMAYTELILRYNNNIRELNTKSFMEFLCYEEYYDQILAVNVACQAGHWNIVTLLAKSRGLQPEVVSALGQILQSVRAPRPNDYDFLLAVSEPCLIQSLLIYSNSSHEIFNYIRLNIDMFPIDILQRFAVQLDPSQPCVISLVSRLFHIDKFTQQQQQTSLDSTIESLLDFENPDRSILIIKELIETFLIVLINLVSKTNNLDYDLKLLENIDSPEIEIQDCKLKKLPDFCPLSCGYEHAGVVRNGNLYTMGVSSSGCLGLGPLLTQSSPPKLIQTLNDLKLKVLSVSCGRKHTLALTDYGVYAWGSNLYGQLGLGPSIQESPYPQMIIKLSNLKIVQIICGQYHSIALTSNGQIYTWGWGIHGQLGHGLCNNEYYPKLVDFHLNIKQIAAGHAHSLILIDDGKLYGFGSNVFGQLEKCQQIDTNKCTKPVWVILMPDIYTPIVKITSSYFHNIAICQDQEVYCWGTSPQELRLLQSKNAQKQNGCLTINSNTKIDSWKDSVHIYSGINQRPIEQISVGYRHTAILHNGKILCGKNKDDELYSPKMNDEEHLSYYNQRFLFVSCGLDYTMAIDHSGKVLAWGSPSMAQIILGRSLENDGKKADGKVVVLKNTKRIIKFPTNFQGNSNDFPIEVPGLPTMAITFNPIDHRLLFSKNFVPFSILSIENNEKIKTFFSNLNNENNQRRKSTQFNDIQTIPNYQFGQKTLHYVLQTYHGFYDSENILMKCLDNNNYQAASKLAMLDGHFSDSLGFQLIAFKKFMNKFDLNFDKIFKETNLTNTNIKKDYDVELVVVKNYTTSNHNSPAHILSSSSSLDSIRQWGDDIEHQGGCESPCDVLLSSSSSDIGDVRQNINQYVQSLKINEPPISSVSKIVSSNQHENDLINKSNSNNLNDLIKDKNMCEIIELASKLVEFYIKKIYLSENHILMQNILLKCIEFWLQNNLPVIVLENVLLKNMDKYFYPLSILLFCKNFNNNLNNDDNDDDIKKSDDDNEDKSDDKEKKKNSASFLKEFSTKFCLQLCSMVLENVNKS